MSKKESITGYYFGPIMFSKDLTESIDIMNTTTDTEMIMGMIDGTLRGLKPEFKVGWHQCTICLKNYEDCDHKAGKVYKGKVCLLDLQDPQIISYSVVTRSRDPKVMINDLLVVEKKGTQSRYTWCGFECDEEKRRFHHIQKAKDRGLVSERIALSFVEFFSETFIGNTTYSPKSKNVRKHRVRERPWFVFR